MESLHSVLGDGNRYPTAFQEINPRLAPMDDQASTNDGTASTKMQGDDAPESKGDPGNISVRLYLLAFAMLAAAISYGLTFVWPGENRSLVYLPRFLTSCVLAFLVSRLLRLQPRS